METARLDPHVDAAERPDPASSIRVGAAFVTGIVEGRFDVIEGLFAPQVRFRAVTPRTVREAGSARAARAVVEDWFGGTDRRQLIQSSVSLIADRVAVDYRLRLREDGETWTVEQHAFAVIRADRIADVWLLCSGFCSASSRFS